MIEVFKTNVLDQGQANKLIDLIHLHFMDYKANFDLEDCDRILRVKSPVGSVCPTLLINLLRNEGYDAEVLADELPPIQNSSSDRSS